MQRVVLLQESEDLLVPISDDTIAVTATETKLRIRKPTGKDAGRYRVAAKNKYGEGSAFISLRIVGKSRGFRIIFLLIRS